jgi:hypothetical protein
MDLKDYFAPDLPIYTQPSTTCVPQGCKVVAITKRIRTQTAGH